MTEDTGIIYPTIELGGTTYTVKFTRGGLLYRLEKSGTAIADCLNLASFAKAIDLLHAALWGQFKGTAEDLAEIVLNEGKIAAVSLVLTEALKKVSPPTQSAAAVAEAPLRTQ